MARAFSSCLGALLLLGTSRQYGLMPRRARTPNMRRLTVMLALAFAVATAGINLQGAQKAPAPVKPKPPKGFTAKL